MPILIIPPILYFWLMSSIVHAADPQLMKQLAGLQQQVAFLQHELKSLKRVVGSTPDGTVRITAPQHKQEITHGNQQEEIAGNLQVRIGKQVVISAVDRLILQAGKASLVLNKDGDITIEGKNIQIKGSADVIIKGAKVRTN